MNEMRNKIAEFTNPGTPPPMETKTPVSDEKSEKMVNLEQLFSKYTPAEVIGMIIAINGPIKNYSTDGLSDDDLQARTPTTYTAGSGRKMIGLAPGANLGYAPKFGFDELIFLINKSVVVKESQSMKSPSMIMVPYPRFEDSAELGAKSEVVIFSQAQITAILALQ